MRFIPAHGLLPHLGIFRKISIAFRLFVLLISFKTVRRVPLFKIVFASALVVVGSHDAAVGSYTKLDRELKPFLDETQF